MRRQNTAAVLAASILLVLSAPHPALAHDEVGSVGSTTTSSNEVSNEATTTDELEEASPVTLEIGQMPSSDGATATVDLSQGGGGAPSVGVLVAAVSLIILVYRLRRRFSK